MAITRFAPSPTGYLHIGGLRTALYNFLWARKTNGTFRLRIEDTDTARNNEAAMKAIINAFEWVGMNYDDTVEYQSKRLDIYKKYVNKLLEEGKAYKCYMSKDELAEIRAKQEALKQTPKYDGTWRPEEGKILPKIPSNIEPVIRMKCPQEGTIEFEDGIKGHMKFNATDVDDFVIARSNGIPTYNFVVTIDDYLMNMTDVIRGDDHLSNTPKQIVIYNALGIKIPKFYHVPMINNPQGKKLSKRDGAMDVMEYKNQGYLPEALLNFLVRLGWSHGDQEIFSMEEMLEYFDPSNINKSASSYNAKKLLWLNSEYIKKMDNSRLEKEMLNFDLDISNYSKKEFLLNVCKQRANTLLELKEAINSILEEPIEYEEKGSRKFIKENTIDMLNEYVSVIKLNEEKFNSVEEIESFTRPFIEENELKFPQLFQPIRIALTGGTKAPSVYDIMYILEYDVVIKRLEKAINKNFNKKD